MNFEDFFMKALWPLFKKLVEQILEIVIAWLLKKVQDFFDKRDRGNFEEANAKAEDAYTQASQASTPEDAARHEAVAKVWREVAEKFRQNNEALAEELEKLRTEATQKSNEAVEKMSADNFLRANADGKGIPPPEQGLFRLE
jgi:cytochrome c556